MKFSLFRVTFAILSGSAALAQTPCGDLRALKLPDASITSAQSVAAGATPAHCEVRAILTPSSDSHIELAVWLPTSGWNGKFQAVGNGGWAGSISFDAMGAALREGYATASTDTGHQSAVTPGGSFALDHPEKLIDFGYRAVHESAVKAKAIIAAFYGTPAKLAYWNSCSNGGRQGLMEAQRYPEDFDGIVAGAPAANWTGRALGALWVGQAVHKDDASYIPPAKYAAVHEAALKACDALDGVRDGVVADPEHCKFDPVVLRCTGTDNPACLTDPQVEAARTIYARREFFPGLAAGSELGWATYGGPRPFAIGNDYARFVLATNPALDYRELDIPAAAAKAVKLDAGVTNALNPKLQAFLARGGKLLQYHGWSDPQIPPMHSVDYYESVLKAAGSAAKIEESYRLFMVPGMQHCGGGPGPNQFNALAALERWREEGVAPAQIIAVHVTNNKVDMTRPLCPYPQLARYKGTGSTNDASNFVCK